METKDFNVIKRDKTKEILSYDKIYNRTKTLGDIYNISIEYSALVTKIIDLLYNNIETSKIDELIFLRYLFLKNLLLSKSFSSTLCNS